MMDGCYGCWMDAGCYGCYGCYRLDAMDAMDMDAMDAIWMLWMRDIISSRRAISQPGFLKPGKLDAGCWMLWMLWMKGNQSARFFKAGKVLCYGCYYFFPKGNQSARFFKAGKVGYYFFPEGNQSARIFKAGKVGWMLDNYYFFPLAGIDWSDAFISSRIIAKGKVGYQQ